MLDSESGIITASLESLFFFFTPFNYRQTDVFLACFIRSAAHRNRLTLFMHANSLFAP